MFRQKMRPVPSLQDILLSSNTKWHSPDLKNHKLFKKGFKNYRGLVRIDDVVFSTIVRVGEAHFGNIFYDINLEVDSYLPHTKNSASDIKDESTSNNIISQNGKNVNSDTRFSLKKNNDLGNFGVKIDTELNNLSRGKMSKVWNALQKKQVEEGVRSAYRNYKDGNTKEGNLYKNAVLLDTDFFDGISPRKWWKKLKEKVESRSKENPFILPITDENGNVQILQIAGSNDWMKTKGGKDRRVNSELYATSDNISKLSVIHIDEVVEVSEADNPYYSSPTKNQWIDKNGWLHRKATVINSKNGDIFEIVLDIAKADDGRHILYSTKGKIKK